MEDYIEKCKHKYNRDLINKVITLLELTHPVSGFRLNPCDISIIVRVHYKVVYNISKIIRK